MRKPQRMSQRARERALFRYWSALQRGDFDTVVAVLKLAERDAILDRMLAEVAVEDEGPVPRIQKTTASMYLRTKDAEITLIHRDPSPDGRSPNSTGSREDNTMNTDAGFLRWSSRRPRIGDARLYRWDPVTLSAVILIGILLGWVFVSRSTILGPIGPQVENLPTQTAPPLPLIVGTLENVHQFTLLHVLGGYDKLNDAAWSPDGRFLALASEGDDIFILDPSNLTQAPRRLQGHTAAVLSLAFSPSGLLASTSGDGTIRLWDLDTGEIQQVLEVMQARNAVFSPDGLLLAASSSQDILVWNIETGEQVLTLSESTQFVSSLAFSADGTVLASASIDKTIRLWAIPDGTLLREFDGLSARITSLAFSPVGQQLAASLDDGGVELHDLEANDAVREASFGEARPDRISKVRFSPDGSVLAAADDSGVVHLLDADTLTVQATLQGHTGQLSGLVFSPDGGKLVTVGSDQTLRLWDIVSGAEVDQILTPAGQQQVKALAYSPDGRTLASAGLDQTIWLWDTSTWLPRAILQGHKQTVWGVDFSPDSSLLVSSSEDGTLRLWDAATGEAVRTIEGARGAWNVRFSPDGSTVASAGIDRLLQVWDVATGEETIQFEGTGLGDVVTYNPEGNLVAIGAEDGTIHVWDTATGTEVTILEGYPGNVNVLTFSPDGNVLAYGSGSSEVRLWDVATWQPLRDWTSGRSIVALAYSPDGNLLLSAHVGGGATSPLNIWDSRTGELLHTLDHPVPYIDGLAVSPDGTLVATGSGDGRIRIWRMTAPGETP